MQWKRLARRLALGAAAFAGQACVSPATRGALHDATARSDLATRAHDFVAPAEDAGAKPPRAEPPDDAALAGKVDRAMLERAALARQPALVAAAHRVRALAADAGAEGSLPPPELMGQLWMVPLARPWAVNDAGMLMVTARQAIPAPGSLDAKAAAGAFEARAEALQIEARARALIRDVDRAFADYAQATGNHRNHVEHGALAERMIRAAEARYAVRGPLSDVTKAELERARLEGDIATEMGAVAIARARLNGLLARAPDAPLGAPDVRDPETVAADLGQVAERAAAGSPTASAAAWMEKSASKAELAARREATWPSLTVGLDYFAPVGPNEHGWGAEIGMSLPWLWGPAPKRAEAAKQRGLAARADARAAESDARAQAGAAWVEVRARTTQYLALRDGALPSARRGLDVAEAGYAAGSTTLLDWLDAARTWLDVQTEMTDARGDLDRALAELDFAANEHVRRAPLPAPKEADHVR
jgi:outer membrane protein TolC